MGFYSIHICIADEFIYSSDSSALFYTLLPESNEAEQHLHKQNPDRPIDQRVPRSTNTATADFRPNKNPSLKFPLHLPSPFSPTTKSPNQNKKGEGVGECIYIPTKPHNELRARLSYHQFFLAGNIISPAMKLHDALTQQTDKKNLLKVKQYDWN